MLGGIGSGICTATIMSILSNLPSHERDKYIGWVFTSTGIGLILGPVIGSIFYQIGGFAASFLISATLLFIFLNLVYKNLVYADVLEKRTRRLSNDLW